MSQEIKKLGKLQKDCLSIIALLDKLCSWLSAGPNQTLFEQEDAMSLFKPRQARCLRKKRKSSIKRILNSRSTDNWEKKRTFHPCLSTSKLLQLDIIYVWRTESSKLREEMLKILGTDGAHERERKGHILPSQEGKINMDENILSIDS